MENVFNNFIYSVMTRKPKKMNIAIWFVEPLDFCFSEFLTLLPYYHFNKKYVCMEGTNKLHVFKEMEFYKSVLSIGYNFSCSRCD